VGPLSRCFSFPESQQHSHGKAQVTCRPGTGPTARRVLGPVSDDGDQRHRGPIGWAPPDVRDRDRAGRPPRNQRRGQQVNQRRASGKSPTAGCPATGRSRRSGPNLLRCGVTVLAEPREHSMIPTTMPSSGHHTKVCRERPDGRPVVMPARKLLTDPPGQQQVVKSAPNRTKWR